MEKINLDKENLLHILRMAEAGDPPQNRVRRYIEELENE